MEQLLWYLLAGTRGGANRIRILEALREQPRNAHQLAELLALDYRTTRHHLDILLKNHVVTRPAGDAYGSVYMASGLFEANLQAFERIRAKVRPPAGEKLAKEDKTDQN